MSTFVRLLGVLALATFVALAPLSRSRADGPLPAFARGRGDLDVSGDGRFGLFAGKRELVVWELASGKRKHRARLTAATWEIFPNPNGEIVMLSAPGRLAEVLLLTGRVVVDQVAKTIPGAHEIAWAPEGEEVILVGWELDELEPGDGLPIAYFEPRLGYVQRQIRIPGLTATRGAAVLADGAGVVVGTPRHLLYLGRSLVDVRTGTHSGAADLRVVAAFGEGVLVVQGGRLEVLDPKTARVLRSLDVAVLPDERLYARPLGRWLVALADKATSVRTIDLDSGRADTIGLKSLGNPRALTPLTDMLVALGRQVVTVPFTTP